MSSLSSLVRDRRRGHASGKQSLTVAVYGATDRGRVREENQDSFTIVEPVNPEVKKRKGVLLAVADGMGGLADGATASRMTVEALRDTYPDSDQEPMAAVESAIKRGNLLVYNQSRALPDQKSMGSTVTAMAIIDHHAYVGHVGDSRAYRLSASGKITRLTKDHTWVEELAARGEIVPGSLQYSLHRSVLTRGLGLRKDVEVDRIEIHDVKPEDMFLLCSDGLHERLDDVEIETCLRARGTDLKAAARDLIGLACERGAPDNVTVVIARVSVGDLAVESRGFEDGEGHDVATVDSSHPTSLFPRPTLLWLPWLLIFAMGVGSTLVLETPPRTWAEPIQQILEDPAYSDLFQSPEGPEIRRALRQHIREARERNR